MRSLQSLATLLTFTLLVTTAGCAKVAVDNKGELKDGGKWEFPLSRGTYRVEMLASGDGAALEWQGCGCRGIKAAKRYSGDCRIAGSGKLVIRNPSLLHLGSPTQVTLKVTKLPR